MDVVTIIVGLLIVVGLVGIVLPVLPGSWLIGAALLVWAVATAHPAAWLVAGVAWLLLAAGWSATYLLAGRRVAASGVPRPSLVVATLAGIAGFFVIPVIGFLVAFPAALFAMEYRRLHDAAAAWDSAWTAIRANALGMVIELGLALLATGTWLVAVLLGVHP
ncbi:DUF456 domain-containing protein [Actinotalea sp. M2MS4P-6]|uniref:DUF456 domain-containing protein n=1 Tax=Actinotalea sp. M2MS4P-6 TaxID=2983762 RepID=UPI0021E3D2B2|nr:DUF456 domain-containing protein [Actinotalea sp. M2MS4P-6]MCV2396479.1 DUF456 domain-containing protein [Actinotalea sp. M2MS4P-6]